MTEPLHAHESGAAGRPEADTTGHPSEPEPAPADPRVARAVGRLDELEDLPPVEHVEVYESVHRSLQESLAEASGEAQPSGDAP